MEPQNLAIIVFLLGLALLGVVLMRLRPKDHRTDQNRPPRRRHRRYHAQTWAHPAQPQAQIVPFERFLESQQGKPAAMPTSDHLDLVAQSGFKVIPMLNRAEARLLPIMERIAAEIGQGHRVMAQVSMGEVLRATNADGQPDFNDPANRAINAKRLDFVIIDQRGFMVAAIEYQGGGHYLGETTFIRDAVKRESLRKAGLQLIELPKNTDELVLRLKLAECTTLPVHVDRGTQQHRDPRH